MGENLDRPPPRLIGSRAITGRLRCDRGTIANYVGRFPELADVRLEADEVLLDFAESALFEAVKAGKSWAVRFVLDRKGASRGWRRPPNRFEPDHTEQPLLITIVGGLPDGPGSLADGPCGNISHASPIQPGHLDDPADIIEAAAREIFG